MSVVLDTSAVLAAMFGEDGADRVLPHLAQSISLISAVNFAEIASKLIDRDYTDEDARTTMSDLRALVRPLDADTALLTGLLRRQTRAGGLSLGDRACLALAISEGYAALTADRIWADIAEAAQVRVEVIR